MSAGNRLVRRSGCSVLAAVLLVLSFPPPAAGETAGRRAVRAAGAVTGVELGLEGSLQVPRGGRLRWLVTTFEVLGFRDLRPAPGSVVALTTSLDPSEVAAEVVTDATGRGALELEVPDDAPSSFRAVLRVEAPSGVSRRFELSILATEPRVLELHAARSVVRPGGTLRVFGRLGIGSTGRPVEQEVVRLTLRDAASRPVGEPVRVSTNAAGLFEHRFRLPARVVGGASVEAEVGEERRILRRVAHVGVAEPSAPALLVAVAPARRVVRPNDEVPLAVVVRTSNGRPVSGAEVVLEGVPREWSRRLATTDHAGRASLVWLAPSIGSGTDDATLTVSASREGSGSGLGEARVRVTATDWDAAIAVEGGALVPALGGRIFVRVVDAEGRAAGGGVPVTLRGPRLPAVGVAGRTDDAGVATLEISLGEPPGGTTDRCGGGAVTALDVAVGQGPPSRTIATCIPLDPDGAARVRVHPPLAVPGQRLTVELTRAPAAARMPLAVAFLLAEDGRLSAVTERLVPAGESQIEVSLPADVVGEVLVRARPVAAPGGEEARGGTAAVFVLPGSPAGIQARFDGGGGGTVRLGSTGPTSARGSAYVVALPLDEARGLASRLAVRGRGPFSEAGRDSAPASEALVAAILAASTPRDDGAPAVLRDGALVPTPAPEDPAAIGLLRDPFRSRARFVTGRLALLFRAVEARVGEAVPEHIDDVAVRGAGGRWEWNAGILDAVAASGELGDAGATGLGGEPLTVEALRTLDPSFTYDTVARRVTRERLFRVVVALRTFVRDRSFDMPWARLGDPATWLQRLRGQYVRELGPVEPRHLVDGWGRPFAIRRAPGGRARFDRVRALDGWEVVSAGPDGRLGTGDDLWDPTARVLAAGTPYAEAVGEDALVARLGGVELGRATVDLLRSSGDFRASVAPPPSRAGAGAERLAASLWSRLPPVLESDPDPLGLRRPAHPGDGAGGLIAPLSDPGDGVSLGLDEEPRSWGVVAWAWTDDGFPATALASGVGGAPLIVEGSLPERLRVGEPATVDFEVTNVSEQTREVRLEVRGGAAVSGRSDGRVALPAGATGRLSARLEAGAPAREALEVAFLDAAGARLRRLTSTVTVDEGSRPVRLRADGGIRDRSLSVRLEIPADASRPVGRVVVLAPSGLTADPELEHVRRRDPGLTAWADALSGTPLSPAQRARLLAAQGPGGAVEGRSPALGAACAAVALGAAGSDDAEAMAALAQVRATLGDILEAEMDVGPEAGTVRVGASVLAALAPGGVPELFESSTRPSDPLSQIAARLRSQVRRAIHVVPAEPSLLARAAAALLLADPGDAHGRAMVELATRSLEQRGAGAARVLPSEALRGEAEALTATFALAVAAHQLGQDELAERLLRGALPGSHVLARHGGEAAFWFLAAGAYGALGSGLPERVAVSVGRRRETVALIGGRAALELDALRPGARTTVRVEAGAGPFLVTRVEAVMGRPWTERSEGPLAFELSGDVGDRESLAALELAVTSSEAVAAPIVELQLPAGVAADARLLGALGASPAVVAAWAREPGFVRMRLVPLVEGGRAVVPMPLRWRAHGALRGLGVVGFPEDRPGAMSVLPPRELSVR